MAVDYINNVTPYKFNWNKFNPILPIVYSEALSYMEALSQYCEKLNEVIELVNNVGDGILEQANAYTDAKVQEQIQLINDAVEEVNELAEDLQIQFDRLSESVQTRIDVLNQEFENFKDVMIADIQAVNARTDLAIQQNNEYLLEQMPTYLAGIKVINFLTGEEKSIQGMFDYLCLLHTQNSITYGELAEREITYGALIDLHMTYGQLVMNGGSIIE